MAEAIMVSIAGKIVDHLVPQALGKVGKLWGVKHELELLRDTVSILQPMLDHAEELCHQNPQIKVWVDKLKDAFYDAQDVIEEFNIEAKRRELWGQNELMKEVRTFFTSSNQLAFTWKMSGRVRIARERIQAIKAERQFHLDERPVNLRVEREWRKREDTYSFIHEGDIIGRDDDKKTIMEFLQDSNVHENVSVLPIVGIGGLGKTTVAKYAYGESKFDLKMWVCVSTSFFDLKMVVKKMITCAKKEETTENTMELLQSILRVAIEGKKYLLVLDDVWNIERETWLELKSLLAGGAGGSKILITTRIPLVAEITGTASPYSLGGLSESGSLDLLMHMAGRKIEEIKDADMLPIGKEIVRKCSGVPLVVRTVGSLLFLKKTKSEWLHFKDHELPEVSQREDKIMSVLRLSYDRLPSHLKRCFAFCSLFPKDHVIDKQTLVNLWVAEGFIQPLDGSQHLEDIGHGFFMDLLWSNFFQNYQKDPWTKKWTCQMHDLMHDLACLVAGTEYWVAWDDRRPLLERTRHISHDLTSNLMAEPPILYLKASALRTFFYVQTYWAEDPSRPTSEEDPCLLIRTFKKLRILDLYATNVKKVPRSICKLKHLTYLDLSYNRSIKRLPNSITGLQNLQILNLCYCSALEELPMGIKKLVSLRSLDIRRCDNLSYMPRGLGQLKSLHTLTHFILPKDKARVKDYCRLGELSGLTNIQGSLQIENLGSVTDAKAESRAANLIGKLSLESLLLHYGRFDTDDAVIKNRHEALFDGLRPHSNLQKLKIERYEGERLPRWMTDDLTSSLPNLVKLRLTDCRRCKHLPQLSQLPHLESLTIIKLPELEYFEPDHSSTLTVSFPNLLKLKIVGCGKLKTMALTPHLEELRLADVNPGLINQLVGLHKLKSLYISSVEFLGCLPEGCLKSLTSLEALTIFGCHKLTSLSLGMRHLSNLVFLSIEDCAELDLCKDGSGNILDFHALPRLRSVQIYDVPKLESLPQWLLQTSNLELLKILRCSNLKVLPEQIEALHSLQRLYIRGCPLLTSLPEGMQRLASLSHLTIEDCPELEEKCKKNAGKDWYKIAHIPHIEFFSIAHFPF